MSFGMERKNPTHHEEVDTEGTWAISYGDMITLLLAFFVLFFTVDPERETENQLQQSLVMELKKAANEYPNPAHALDKTSSREPASIHVGNEGDKNINPNIIKKWGGKVYKLGHRIIIDFPGTSFFHLGYIDVNDEGKKQLEEFVKVYLPYAGQYVLGIRAYTDSRKVSYKRRYRDNLELSALRSISTMRTLRELGIPLERMRLGGYGELKITRDKLVAYANEKGVEDIQSFSRKVVLVIEPEAKEEGSI